LVSCKPDDKDNKDHLPKDILGFTPTELIPTEIPLPVESEHPAELPAELIPKDNSLVALENPVVNPPFNNWSVNQPSPPHDSGLSK
jgi:hypothetical protein